MRVRVLSFGLLRDHLGTPELPAELPDGASVSDLLQLLRSRSSNSHMHPVWRTLAVAVNREYAPASHVLHDGDEVALLPPVSGGLAA